MRELPKGWAHVILTEATLLITKGTTPTSIGFSFEDSGIRFIKVENLKDGKIDASSTQNFISRECHQALLRSQLHINDVLFSIAGTIDKTAIVSESDIPANTNQALSLIRPTLDLLEPRFLRYQLESEITIGMKEQARGGAMNNISLGDIGKQLIALPPLNEQKRIADRLDLLLTRIDKTKAHLGRIPHCSSVSANPSSPLPPQGNSRKTGGKRMGKFNHFQKFCQPFNMNGNGIIMVAIQSHFCQRMMI